MLREILCLTNTVPLRCDHGFANPKILYTPLHIHGEIEIIYVTSGTLTYNIGGKEYQLKKDDCIITASNIPHSSLASLDESHYVLYINPSLLSSVYSDNALFDIVENIPYKIINKDFECHEELKNCISALEQYKNNKKLSDYYIRGYFFLILGYLTKINFLSSYVTNKDDKQSIKVEAIISYIKSHYNEDLTLEKLGKEFFLNPSYLCRMFKDSTNHTIIEFINMIRVKKAEALLVSTNKSLLEIATDVGFSSQSYFTKTFKKVDSVSPLQYRKFKVDSKYQNAINTVKK